MFSVRHQISRHIRQARALSLGVDLRDRGDVSSGSNEYLARIERHYVCRLRIAFHPRDVVFLEKSSSGTESIDSARPVTVKHQDVAIGRVHRYLGDAAQLRLPRCLRCDVALDLSDS